MFVNKTKTKQNKKKHKVDHTDLECLSAVLSKEYFRLQSDKENVAYHDTIPMHGDEVEDVKVVGDMTSSSKEIQFLVDARERGSPESNQVLTCGPAWLCEL